MAVETLEQEVERLRAEVEAYRQRELAELRNQLLAAREERDHYRSEAHRNADIARQIDANAQEHIARLKTEIEVKNQTNLRQAARSSFRGRN